MAFASVQIGPNVFGTGSAALTLPAASTAGTLLVACVFNTSGAAFTAPAGWMFAKSAQQGSVSRTAVWYYPGNPGGITTATFTASGNCRGTLAEFSTAAGKVQALDQVGFNSGAPPATSFAVTAAGSSAAGDLGIAAFGDAFTTATTGIGWTLPSGYTVLHNQANSVNSYSASYEIGLGAGVQTVTGSYASSANQAGWTGVFAAFSEVTPAALAVATTVLPAGKVGVNYTGATLLANNGVPPYSWAVTVGSLPAGLSITGGGGGASRGGGFGVTAFRQGPAGPGETPDQSIAEWQAAVGRPVTCRKIYFKDAAHGDPFPTTAGGDVQSCLDNNLTAYLCYLPAYNPPTTADFNKLQASLQAFSNMGLKAKVVLYQEVEHQPPSAAQYKTLVAFYEPAIHAVYPGGLVHNSSGSYPGQWGAYFPGSLGLVDEYGLDFYGSTYAPVSVGGKGFRIDTFVAMVAATGKRFAVMEMGSSLGAAPLPPQAVVTEYLNYINSIAAANPPGSYMWYEADNTNPNNVLTDPSDFRVPLLQQISDTVTASGGGSPSAITGSPTAAGTSSFTLQVTDTAAATATAAESIVIAAAAPPLITTTSLPAATTGVPYSQQLAETGGQAPLTWGLALNAAPPGGTVVPGALPDGLTLDPAAGIIAGTPAADAATSGFTVTLTDANAQTDSQTLFITVVAAAPTPMPYAPRPGWPQVVIEAGLLPAAPQVPAGTFILDDPVYGKLDSNMLGDSTSWTDIAGLLRTGTVIRPSTRTQGPLVTYQGGTATAVFDNTSGILDPDNPSGPFYGTLRPMIPVRARAVYGSVSYPMWSGFISSLSGADLTYDMGYDEMTITADDGFKVLAGITIPAIPPDGQGDGAGDGEDSGARITRILNAAAWYTDHRRVDTGDSLVQGTLFGDTALNLLQLTADSEIGGLYMDGAGNLTYRHRQAILEDARSAQVQAVFGDLPGFTVLTADDSGFEGSAGTWTGAGNCSTSQSAVVAHSGFQSLAMSSQAAGDMTAAHCLAANILTQGLPVSPGLPVQASVWARANSVVRTVQAGAQFYNAAGTSLGAPVYGAAVTDIITSWVQATASLTAPAGAAFCRLSVLVQGTAAATEVHYVDDAQLYYPELACIPHRRAVDDTTLANDIQATSVGGSLQEAQSAKSERTYLFPRTYARSDLLLMDGPTTLQWAQWVLAVSLAGDDRFDSVTIDPVADPANLFPQVLAREIGDRIQVWRRPQNSGVTITQDCFIRGIQHDVDAVNGTWSTTWTLQSALRYTGFLILDNPVTGLLDTGKLAF